VTALGESPRPAPAPPVGAPPSEVVALIDDTLATLASGESAVPRRDVLDAFLDLRLAVVTMDAVEHFLAGQTTAPPAHWKRDPAARQEV